MRPPVSVILAVVALSAFTSTPAMASTTFPGRNGKIAVLTRSLDPGACSEYQVGLVTKQRGVRRLLPDPCDIPKVYDQLDFSPGGRRLVCFTSKRGGGHYRIAVLNLKTSRQREVLAPERRAGVENLSYLPDGRIEAGFTATVKAHIPAGVWRATVTGRFLKRGKERGVIKSAPRPGEPSKCGTQTGYRTSTK